MGWRETLHQHLGTVRVGAVLAPLVACAVMSLWRESVTDSTAVLVLAAVIVAAASVGDRYAGVLAAVSSGAWFDFFLTEPYLRFTIDDPDDIGDMVLLVLIGVAVTEIALWGEREQARASRRTGYLDGVLGTAELVLATHDSVEDLIDRVTGQITAVLGVTRTRFVAGPLHDSRLAVLDHDGVVTRAGRRVDVSRDGLPTDEETALLVVRDGETLGYFVVTSATDIARPSVEQRRVAVLMADQVASLLGRRLG